VYNLGYLGELVSH